jgi:hypothetical protein
MTDARKKLLHRFGSALALAGLGWMAYRFFFQEGTAISLPALGIAQYVFLAALLLVNTLTGFVLAAAWRQVLAYLGSSINSSAAIRIYGTSQIARYLPGNIFHLAGRQGLGIAAGLPSVALLKSAGWELGLLGMIAACFVLPILPIYHAPLQNFLVPLTLCFLVILTIIGGAVFLYFGAHLFRALAAYCLFLVVAGLAFSGVVAAVSESWQFEWWITTCAFIVAWLAGVLVPGAPAGVGVREAVLLSILGDFLSLPIALSAIGLSRLITAGGDVIFWLIAQQIDEINPPC